MNDVKIYVSIECDSKIAYYKLGDKIYRKELYDLQEIFETLNIKNYDDGIKRGLIRECLNNDKELVTLQSEFVTQQLNNGVLNGFSSPLDDDIICKEFFDELLKQGEGKKWGNLFSWNIRNIRLKKDSKFNNVPLTNGSYSSTQLLSYILNNYNSIVKIFKTNFLKNSIKKLLPYKNDLIFLENFLKVIYSHNEDEIKNNKVINMFNENELEEFINFFGNFLDLQAEHIGSKSISIGGYEARIYLNNHNGNILSQFLSKYAIECLKNGIEYDMKGIYNIAGNGCDGSVLYTEKKDFPKRIQIIESILLEHPEWRVSFSEPIYGTSRFGTGFYGVSHLGGSIEKDGKIQIYGNTYNDYFEHTCVLSLYCMLAKVLVDNNLISSKSETFQLLTDIVSLKNITSNESISLPSNIGINGKKIFTIMEPFTNYFNNPSVMQKIRELGYKVFRDYMYKIHCVTQHLPEGTKVDIAINKDMLDYFGKDELAKEPETPIVEVKNKKEIETKQTKDDSALDNLWQSFNSIRSKLDNPELVNICVSVIRKIICTDIEMGDYDVKESLLGYTCANSVDSYKLKYMPIKRFGLRYTLCVNKNTILLYDRINNEYTTEWDIKDIEYDDNFIFDKKNKKVYFMYENQMIDITKYYNKYLRDNVITNIKDGITDIISESEFSFLNRDKIEELLRKIKEEKKKKEESEKQTKNVEVIKSIKKKEIRLEQDKQKAKLEALETLKKAFESLRELSNDNDVLPKMTIEENQLLIKVDDHLEISPIYISALRFIDLRYISFDNVKIDGIDFRGTNLILDPQKVYKKNLRGCDFDRIFISPFLNFKGVDIRGCRFSEDDDPRTYDTFNLTFKDAIYDETTTYNGISFTKILNKKNK